MIFFSPLSVLYPIFIRGERMRFRSGIWVILLCVSLPAGGLWAQNDVSLLSEKTIRALNNEISGERAQDYIRNIAHHKRDQASYEYHVAAEWVAGQAEKFGLEDVHIEKYPADDDIYYFMRKARGGWDAEFGELWITGPREEKLTSYADIPVSLANRSQSCDVTGELVFIGDGSHAEDYSGVDVKDKIVLASGPGAAVVSLAVDRFGALGAVTINQRYANDHADIVSRMRIFTETPTFVFGLSRRRGEELRDRLLRGEKLTVRAVVKAEIHPGYYENVIATIPGSDLAREEILLTAHLCHYKPGANDNASGSACLLEIGRALKRLIDEGKIKRPQRTIRFLWVPEMSGSIAYAAEHPDIVARMKAGINYDMVGQYLNDNNSTFFMHCTPHSQPHFINDILINLTEFMGANNVQALVNRNGFGYPITSLSGSRDAFRYRIYPYVGGSDQYIFNDSLLGVPSVFFLVWPDHFYHTSGDKPEICDPTQLKRSAFLGAAALVYLTDDCPHKARRLAGEVYTRAASRIEIEVKRAFDLLNGSDEASLPQNRKEGLNFLTQAFKREIATLAGVKGYSGRDGEVDKLIDGLIGNLKAKRSTCISDLEKYYILSCEARGVVPKKLGLTAEEKSALKIIPARNADLKGPLGWEYVAEKVGPGSVPAEMPINRVDGRMTYEILNFIDGKNSLLDIRNAVSAEYQPVPVAWVREFVELLAEAGVVNL